MKYAKKMSLVPFTEEEKVYVGSGPSIEQSLPEPRRSSGNSIRKYAMDRQRKMLSVVLKLASCGGYDRTGRIKLKDGSYMENSDVISLVMYTLSPGKSMKGISEFVDLLHSAGVAPNEVINANVRELLERRAFPRSSVGYKELKSDAKPESTPKLIDRPSVIQMVPKEEDMHYEVQPAKRKYQREDSDDDIETEEEDTKRIKPAPEKSIWDPEDSDLDD
jgi:hypothetical protein